MRGVVPQRAGRYVNLRSCSSAGDFLSAGFDLRRCSDSCPHAGRSIYEG